MVLKRIVIIGGTGPQSRPVVRTLCESGQYEVVVVARNASVPGRAQRASSLSKLPNASLFDGQYTDEESVREAFKGAHGVFVNTDAFTLGKIPEVFLAMRMFELAVEMGVKHYMWGSADFILKSRDHGYGPTFTWGHVHGKARVSEWLLAQKEEGNAPLIDVLTTCPYINFTLSDMISFFDV